MRRNKQKMPSPDGAEQLLHYFHLDRRSLPDGLETFQEKAEYLSDRPELVMYPVTLEDGWYRTPGGPLYAEDLDGMGCAILPDWQGRYFFLDGARRRRVYLSKQTCGRFRREAYAVVLDHAALEHPGGPVPLSSLLRWIFGSISALEWSILVFLCVLSSLMVRTLGTTAYFLLSSVVREQDRAGFWKMALGQAGALLLFFLAQSCGEQTIRRAAQKAALMVGPCLGERLYLSGRWIHNGRTAERLACLRDHVEQIVQWSLRFFCQLLVVAGLLPVLGAVSAEAQTTALGTAVLLTGFTAASFFFPARKHGEGGALVNLREWFLRRVTDQRTGLNRPFSPPEGRRDWDCVFAVLYPLLVPLSLPLAWIAASRGDSAARLTQALILYLPSALLLPGAAEASGAGRIFAELWALLPEANRQTEESRALPPMGSVLELKDVVFAYPDRRLPVLQGVSLRVEPGEVVGICGASGSGKTTLARIMAGILPPASGGVYYGGTELDRYRRVSLARRIAWDTGAEICLLDHVPEQRDGRAYVVFSLREEALSGCGRILRLREGVLVDEG